MDEKLEVMEAPEPSNVNWENIEVEPEVIQKRQVNTFLIIGGYLAVIIIGFMVTLQSLDKSE